MIISECERMLIWKLFMNKIFELMEMSLDSPIFPNPTIIIHNKIIYGVET